MLNALVSGVCCIITTYFLLEYPMCLHHPNTK